MRYLTIIQNIKMDVQTSLFTSLISSTPPYDQTSSLPILFPNLIYFLLIEDYDIGKYKMIILYFFICFNFLINL